MEFGWLHLTDIHVGQQNCLWPTLEHAFLEDLSRTHDRCGPWNAIFFTGDLVQMGNPDEFIQFNERISRVYERLKILGSSDALFFAVPGNHDLIRPPLRSLKPLKQWFNNSRERKRFWNDSKSSLRVLIDNCFSQYREWWNRHPFPRPRIKHGILPGDFSSTIELDGMRIGVIGLNTTFLQLNGNDFVGKLALDPTQLSATCGDYYVDWLNSHQCCFLLTHHPEPWLDKQSRDLFRSDIAVPGRFIAHLCGHLHEPRAITISVAGAEPTRLWQGCSLFGLEYFGREQRYSRRHGYSAGHISSDGESYSIRLWPRRAEQHQYGHWYLSKDPSFTLKEDEGTPEERSTISRNDSRSQARSVIKVLLLATNSDLADARKSIATHIGTALGVTVHEAPYVSDTSAYDLVVLIQAWQWNNGRTTDCWHLVPDDKKLVFIINEISPWPPLQVESQAMEQIIKFRKELVNAHVFDEKQDLPRQVKDAISSFVRSQQKGQQFGLYSWEQHYLEFRLPTWSFGKTARSVPHLLDVTSAHELYEPSLYISVDGLIRGWGRGHHGRPERLTDMDQDGTHGRNITDRTLNDSEEDKHEDDLRLPRTSDFWEGANRSYDMRIPLSRWLSVSELPHLALVGAPGAGKTVFLTRVAASLAHSWLGSPVNFEPELYLEELRGAGQLPIPIVIEATRIAARELDAIQALIESLQDELGSGSSRPSSSLVMAGLDSGRYIVMIDAIDEIPDATTRNRVLDLLKGVSKRLHKTKLILTTRSARYTGTLTFHPEFETLEVAPLTPKQAHQLCSNWAQHHQQGDDYKNEIINAISGLDPVLAGATEEPGLTENPLMLTAICMVYEQYRRLPDDRGRLCELLVDDLCKSRRSEDMRNGWKLEDSQKKELLQMIAFEMQREAAQSWPTSKAADLAQQLVPENEQFRAQRAERYIYWVADHTGILRFQRSDTGEEQVRFWHRVFREYLAAMRIAQEDTTAPDKAHWLWEDGKFLDPFWEDVVRLLPRALGTIKRAEHFGKAVKDLADRHASARGRLLGLYASAIIENRDLFPHVDVLQLANHMAITYERFGMKWKLSDRLMFLDALGRLEPSVGDPRHLSDRWVDFEVRKTRHASKKWQHVLLSWTPVTVQEFRQFVNSQDWQKPDFWKGLPERVVQRRDSLLERVRHQRRYLNRPMVNVGIGEAIAFCRWQTSKRTDGLIVRLPFIPEWRAVVGSIRRPDLPWGTYGLGSGDEAKLNYREANIGHATPVAAFPNHARISDLFGNVWEWTIRLGSNRPRPPEFALVGCSFDTPVLHTRELLEPKFYPSTLTLVQGEDSIGFRCVLGKEPMPDKYTY